MNVPSTHHPGQHVGITIKRGQIPTNVGQGITFSKRSKFDAEEALYQRYERCEELRAGYVESTFPTFLDLGLPYIILKEDLQHNQAAR